MASYIIKRTNEGYSVYFNDLQWKALNLLKSKKTLSEVIGYIILEGMDPCRTIRFDNFKPDKETRNLIALVLKEYRWASKFERELERERRDNEIWVENDLFE